MTEYDEQLESLSQTLSEVDGLLNDFNRELSSYMDDMTFDESVFYETERRLDLLNGLKSQIRSAYRRNPGIPEKTAGKAEQTSEV